VSQALLSEASGSDLPSAATSLSEELSKMSTSSSIGLMAQGEAAPPGAGDYSLEFKKEPDSS